MWRIRVLQLVLLACMTSAGLSELTTNEANCETTRTELTQCISPFFNTLTYATSLWERRHDTFEAYKNIIDLFNRGEHMQRYAHLLTEQSRNALDRLQAISAANMQVAQANYAKLKSYFDNVNKEALQQTSQKIYSSHFNVYGYPCEGRTATIDALSTCQMPLLSYKIDQIVSIVNSRNQGLANYAENTVALCRKYHTYRSMDSLNFGADTSAPEYLLRTLTDMFGELISSINTEMEKERCYEHLKQCPWRSVKTCYKLARRTADIDNNEYDSTLKSAQKAIDEHANKTGTIQPLTEITTSGIFKVKLVPSDFDVDPATKNYLGIRAAEQRCFSENQGNVCSNALLDCVLDAQQSG